MAKAKIVGVGLYAPGEPINHDELKKLADIEFDASKLESKLGYDKRHLAQLRGIDETTADFATKAALAAIKNAGIDAKQVGLFIVGTDSPEYISPATSVLVQGRIQGGEQFSGAFDVVSSCASAMTAFDIAAKMIAGDPALEYAVVTGVYNMSRYIRKGDVFSIPMFSDGAGAFVLKRTEDSDPSGYMNNLFLADGTQWDYLGVYAGGTRKPVTHELLDKGEYGLESLKPLPGDRNIKLWPKFLEKLLEKAKITVKDIDHIIFTQINRFVIQEVMKIIGLPMEKTTCIMNKYGYTGSACVPMAFAEAVQAGSVKKGDTVVFIASGSGLTVAGNVFKY
ncbi:MAG TPA: ketoacyl-ACP synthase III [Spirochaetia bacterium]|nr:MAG: hypothetical protein A2Y41_00255 [Spirochaetes bacterium GWB1_36_13]HCL57425.1 ketoacyl-ACP synthase III [Spirochaetia bacterium]